MRDAAFLPDSNGVPDEGTLGGDGLGSRDDAVEVRQRQVERVSV